MTEILRSEVRSVYVLSQWWRENFTPPWRHVTWHYHIHSVGGRFTRCLLPWTGAPPRGQRADREAARWGQVRRRSFFSVFCLFVLLLLNMMCLLV